MDNIQFLHNCCDDCDRDVKQCSTHCFFHNCNDCDVSQTGFFTPPGVSELSELQDRHDLLLNDIQYQTVSNMTCCNCLKSIILAGFANCDSVLVDIPQFIKDGSINLTTM